MFEKDEGFVGLLIGFGLGFIAAIVLTKAKEAAPSTTLEPCQTSSLNALSGWRPLSTIPSVDRLGEYKPMPVLELASGNQSSTPGVTSYKNSEKIKVLRGPDGRIIGYDTDRNAKIS